MVENTDTTKFTFSTAAVDRVYFLLADKVNNDSLSKLGNGHFEGQIFTTKQQLINNLNELKKQNISNEIFSFRAEINDEKSKIEIKKLFTKSMATEPKTQIQTMDWIGM